MGKNMAPTEKKLTRTACITSKKTKIERTSFIFTDVANIIRLLFFAGDTTTKNEKKITQVGLTCRI